MRLVLIRLQIVIILITAASVRLTCSVIVFNVFRGTSIAQFDPTDVLL